jgi:uncharacterized membrane protein
MPEKRSKYDTDPLDPDYVRKTAEVWPEGATRLVDDANLTTGQIGGETRRIDPAAPPRPQPPRYAPDPEARYAPDSEAPTRRIDNAIPHSYPSVFVPPPYQPPPAAQTYAPPAAAHAQQPQTPHGLHGARPFAPERNVAGLGIPERYANVAAYAPFYIGLVVSVIELLIAPRSEARTRYHAAQALGLHLAFLAVGFVLGMIGGLGGMRAGAILFSLASTAFLIYSMIKVWNGRQHRLAPLADVTRFLDERIDPRK